MDDDRKYKPKNDDYLFEDDEDTEDEGFEEDEGTAG
jgi:hypothetical protein